MEKETQPNDITRLILNGISAYMKNITNSNVYDAYHYKQTTKCGLSWEPPCSIIDGKTFFKVLIELPGVNPSDIDIEVNCNKIIVSGNKVLPEDFKENKNNVYRGSFNKVIKCPVCITDKRHVELEYKYGSIIISVNKELEANNFKLSID